MLHVLPQLQVCMLEEAKLKIIEEVTRKIASKPTDSYYFNFFPVVFFLSQEDISENDTMYKILAGLCRPHRIILLPMLCQLPLNGNNEVIHADMHMEELLVCNRGIPYRPVGGGKPFMMPSCGEGESWRKVAQRKAQLEKHGFFTVTRGCSSP